MEKVVTEMLKWLRKEHKAASKKGELAKKMNHMVEYEVCIKQWNTLFMTIYELETRLAGIGRNDLCKLRAFKGE